MRAPRFNEDPIARAEAWFAERGKRVFPFQREAWQAYLAGESGLINAPTGSGKTLAAWLGPVIEAEARVETAVRQGPRVLWVTPLRALANDLAVSLAEPLEALAPGWRVERRTGDTSPSARARQREKPPHALVITPESISILLSYEKSHDQLRHLACVVVDEWHELLGTKRGVLLELSLAHLRALNPGLRVWGLSATLPNLDEAMHALLGPKKPGRIIRARMDKDVEVDSIIPRDVGRFPSAGHLGVTLVDEVIAAIDKGGSTLLFTNTRSQAELWYRAIVGKRLDWLTVVALHHGSVDRKLRARIEQAIKSGELRCVVCTSSLDLGVDFAPVDQVIQVGSPKGIGRLMQRAGRSGHRPGVKSRVLCVPTHAWELVEIAAARAATGHRQIEPRRPLRKSLDVLVQHAVTLATGPGFEEEALLREVRDTHAFAQITDREWRWVQDFITRGGSALQGYPQYRRVVRLDGLHRVADSRLARHHRMSIGTIASDTEMVVKWASGGTLGTVEESFIGRLKIGDSFLFAGRTLKLVQVKDMTAYVRMSKGKKGELPRWQGGRLPLSVELADAVLAVLADPRASETYPEMRAIAPLLELQKRWSRIPTPDTLLAERMKTRDGYLLYVYPFCGRLANEGIATLVAARWAQQRPQTFTISANDYGFELLSPSPIEANEQSLRAVLSADRLAEDLLSSVNLTEISRRQFRDIARISGLVFQGFPGSGKSTRQLQASSGLIYDVLTQYDPSNLLLMQAQLEVLDAQLESTRIASALGRLENRSIVICDPVKTTPLAFPIWAGRLQTQTLSTESWQSRIERAAQELEAYALATEAPQ